MPNPKVTVEVWSAESGPADEDLCKALDVVVDKMRMSAALTDMPTNFLNTTTYFNSVQIELFTVSGVDTLLLWNISWLV